MFIHLGDDQLVLHQQTKYNMSHYGRISVEARNKLSEMNELALIQEQYLNIENTICIWNDLALIILRDDFIMSVHSSKLNKIELLQIYSDEDREFELFLLLKKMLIKLMNKLVDSPPCLDIILHKNACHRDFRSRNNFHRLTNKAIKKADTEKYFVYKLNKLGKV